MTERQVSPIMPDQEGLLVAHNLHKNYRRGAETVKALQGVSLHLAPGEFIAVVGASGSGKTTLLSLLAGFETPDEGDLRWSPRLAKAQNWGDIALLPQRFLLCEELTLLENVHLPVRLRDSAADSSSAQSLLDDLGIGPLANRSPYEVSLGEQQRTAVARALVLSPALLLADEPTSRLDEDRALQVLGELHRRTRTGMTAVVASHDELVLRHADRVLELVDGSLLAPGSWT